MCCCMTVDVEIDLVARQVLVDGTPIDLTRKEFDIVAVLARYPGVAVPKERLIREVWKHRLARFGHSLEVHVGAIREDRSPRGHRDRAWCRISACGARDACGAV